MSLELIVLDNFMFSSIEGTWNSSEPSLNWLPYHNYKSNSVTHPKFTKDQERLKHGMSELIVHDLTIRKRFAKIVSIRTFPTKGHFRPKKKKNISHSTKKKKIPKTFGYITYGMV